MHERLSVIARLMGAAVHPANVAIAHAMGWPTPEAISPESAARQVTAMVEREPHRWGAVAEAFEAVAREGAEFAALYERCRDATR